MAAPAGRHHAVGAALLVDARLERAGLAISRFIRDGRIAIDNNAVERAMRPIALGRNALFAGSDEGAATWDVVAR